MYLFFHVSSSTARIYRMLTNREKGISLLSDHFNYVLIRLLNSFVRNKINIFFETKYFIQVFLWRCLHCYEENFPKRGRLKSIREHYAQAAAKPKATWCCATSIHIQWRQQIAVDEVLCVLRLLL